MSHSFAPGITVPGPYPIFLLARRQKLSWAALHYRKPRDWIEATYFLYTFTNILFRYLHCLDEVSPHQSEERLWFLDTSLDPLEGDRKGISFPDKGQKWYHQHSWILLIIIKIVMSICQWCPVSGFSFLCIWALIENGVALAGACSLKIYQF